MDEQQSKNVNTRPGGIEPRFPQRPTTSPFQDRSIQVDKTGGIVRKEG